MYSIKFMTQELKDTVIYYVLSLAVIVEIVVYVKRAPICYLALKYNKFTINANTFFAVYTFPYGIKWVGFA